jgi:hypothetical protein
VTIQHESLPGVFMTCSCSSVAIRFMRWDTACSGVSAFVESTINQVVSRRFVKLQQMHWTLRGAHLLLQTRTAVLNDELEGVFRGWYPLFRDRVRAAA